MSKTLTNLSAALVDLDGIRPLRPDGLTTFTIRTALAQCLGRAQSLDPVHAMAVALTLHNLKGDTLEMEEADFKLLKECVTADQGYTNIIKAPLIQCLNDAETPLEPKSPAKKSKE